MYRQELGEALRLNPALLAVRLELVQDYADSNEGHAARDLLDDARSFKSGPPGF